MNLNFSPFSSTLRFLGCVLSGRIHFPRERIGEVITLDDGEWEIFRQVIIDPRPGQNAVPGAVFQARFHVANMSHAQNRLFSLLPIPFFTGLPGFRSKLWLYNHESGDSCGYYEWDSTANAENYRRSFAVRFMTRRSLPGSVSFRVLPNTRRQNNGKSA